MCGITGFFYLDHGRSAERDQIKAMTDTLVHRGPDFGDIFVSGNLALGHRRLSIIDLSTAARQPLANEDSTVWTVFNGEIYNFKQLRIQLEKYGHIFRSAGDTEVIVHAYEQWGVKCFEKFDGMLATAIYDSQQQKLILAKDRFGKKPLYYTMQNGIFAFASEIKALKQHRDIKSELSTLAIERYLAYEYVPTPISIYAQIQKLDAGEFIEIELSAAANQKLQPRRYWSLEFEPKLDISKANAQTKLRELLIKAVEKRLVSDVPLGVFLSGGIDSSAIVWAIAQLREAASIQTFSIGFDDSSFDESRYASQVARYFGTRHREKKFTGDDLLKVLPKVAELLDEPFADPSILPTYLLAQFTRQYVTVALGGDGGDELFAGYDPFIAQRLAQFLELIPPPAIKWLQAVADRLPFSDKNMSWEFRLRHFLKGFSPETLHQPELRNQIWLGPLSLEKFNRNYNGKLSYSRVYAPTLAKINPGLANIDRLSSSYINTYLHDDILVKIDRAAMFNSLEVRSPFLDKDLAEFVARLPVNYKMRGLKTKVLLKESLSGQLPDFVIQRSKKGFGIPLTKWLRQDLADSTRTALFNLTRSMGDLVTTQNVTTMIEQHQSGQSDHRKEIWELFMLNEVCGSSVSGAT